MSTNNHDDRLVRNEQIIRDHNVKAGKGIKQYFHDEKAIAESPVAFICECSVLDCKEHVSLSIKDYMAIHKRADRFVVFPGHEMPKLEKNVECTEDYIIVEKYSLPAKQSADNV